MPEKSKKFYLTTPIYYVNARPHIGHAYTTVVADVIARRHRLLGDDTFFLTGTDEHGQKIERSALAAGVPPQQFADQVSQSFRDLWGRMGITYNDYIRTTEPRHKQAVQRLFQTLKDNGFIYLSTYTGQYCVSDEAYVEGPPGVRCPDCGRTTETVSESNYYFKLSAFQQPIIDLIESGQLLITPDSRRNEVLSFLRGNPFDVILPTPESVEAGAHPPNISEAQALVNAAVEGGTLARSTQRNVYVPGALKDLSISRTSFKWGIPVPGDEAHVIYVWLDALANYMTAVGYGSDAPEDVAKFNHYWPANLHLVGKEIIRFHCVYWPAFLLAAGLPTPKAITAHGWLLFDDSKMSKSKGNIVRTETILDAFGDHYRKELVRLGQPEPTKRDADLFATDVLRYFLLREIPFGQDGSFSFDALIQRYNADLANGYGNLVSRTLSMISQYRGSHIPAVNPDVARAYTLEEAVELLGQATDPGIRARASIPVTINTVQKALDDLDFARAIADGVSIGVSLADFYITQKAPWKLSKNSGAEEELDEVLYTAAESIRIITALLYPILPFATAKVWAQLGLGDIQLASDNGELRTLTWGGLKPGTKLGPLSPIFPRADVSPDKGLARTMADIERNNSTSAPASGHATNQADAQTPTVTEFSEASLASSTGPLAPEATDTPYPAPSRLTNEITSSAPPTHRDPTDLDPTHPAAPPRTGSIPEPNPIAQVAGSASPTVELHKPPTHTEAQASGPFNTQASSQPISSAPANSSPQITIDDFAKVELRVAKILVCERIPKADKLLRLEVDLGYERRQILSGIAEWYTPEELIGRKIVVITNLAPRKMRGLESHGMLLAASTGEDGRPALATFADSDNIEPGARLK